MKQAILITAYKNYHHLEEIIAFFDDDFEIYIHIDRKSIGFIPLPFIRTFGKFGDMSYGIYIYSFPIQQTFMYFFKLKTYELIILSIVCSIIFGYLSWHLIEKRALKYKRKFILNNKDEKELDWENIIDV